ncbi:uncharacterized protein L3040_004115 [Drepanopeziza brunnea f. sp. 'multigermtubi']|uniref:Solute symporter family transporter n=1 Tax=Marssonina brunnea f. sp. multigermtubi (strain MB_m1) TaxID=1072389 RepID=K1XHE7_MARBU|nr:solute symporter family transporter [Drepanopeziza brunnea f. sp. 'multigermtubi' MB_m1]EKD11899.1 solute symporter family transporter [Drepanopeziza brunnea f. sp. 'multigermtubi' MB_m1]KAJ5042718.1 hypothetical protein L3040_004115 [Drepanopeziza brunnea f. sp. 'multigermtubi']
MTSSQISFRLVMTAPACFWHAIGVELGWLFLVMGLLIGGAVFPSAFAVSWDKQSRYGTLGGSLLTAWLVTANTYDGDLMVATTGSSYTTLAGNLAAVLVGLTPTLIISIVKPDNFNWDITRSINVPA